MKTHWLVHAPERILAAGPLHANSMMPWESLWGEVGQCATNRRHPEVSMLHQTTDTEVCELARNRAGELLSHSRRTLAQSAANPQRLAVESADSNVLRSEPDLGRALAGSRAAFLTPGELQVLHAGLVRFAPEEYGQLWEAYLAKYRHLW